MDASELYEMLTEELASESVPAKAWEDLHDRQRIAWAKFARRLERDAPPRQTMLGAYPD
jgi:hypothetical protein